MIRLTLFIALLIVKMAFGQNSLTNITSKYSPYLSATNEGIGVLVQKNGITETANIGNYNFNKHTVFNIGSATKKITAILILQEMEKGNLKLSDSIGMFLQPLQNVGSELSIESLLRHRSGLGEIVGKNFENIFFNQSDSIYNRDHLTTIPAPRPERKGKYTYCNTNYFLLGKILEKITDQSYFDLVRERIFEPCDMTNSYSYISKSLKNLAPPIHKGENVSKYIDYRYFAHYAYAAGAIASTLEDTRKFYEHLFQKNTLIHPESLKQLISFDDADYGLGMMTFKNRFIGHGGNNLGYSFREYYNPTTNELVLFFANTRIIPFGKKLKKELFNYLKGEHNTVQFNSNIVNDFASALGKYAFDSHGMKMDMEVIKRNNHLFFKAQGAEVILISEDTNKLKSSAFGIELEVKNNNYDELIFRQNGLETTIKRIK